MALSPPTSAVKHLHQQCTQRSLAMDGTESLHYCSGPQARANRGPDLPDQVQLSIVAAPSIFAVPTCINKSFKPPFTLRVSVVSSRPTQIKATVAAYTLQREQVRLQTQPEDSIPIWQCLSIPWVGITLETCLGGLILITMQCTCS